MKRIISAAVVALTLVSSAIAQDISTNWDHEILVVSGDQRFDTEEHYAYTTTVFEARENAVRKLVLDEIKTRTEDKATKKAITEGLKVDIPRLDENAITVKVKTDVDKSTSHVDLSIAFLKDGSAINPDEHPEGHKAAMGVMHDFSVYLNQSVVMAQVIDAENELNTLSNKHEALISQKERLQKSIETDKGTIENLNSENAKLQRKLESAQGKAGSLQKLAEGTGATDKDVKKYTNAKKDVASVEQKIVKNNETLSKYNQSVEDKGVKITAKDTEIQEAAAKVETQKQLVTQLNQKHDSIK